MFSFVCIAPRVAFVNASLRLLSKLGKKNMERKSMQLIFREASLLINVQHCTCLQASSPHANRLNETINTMH